MTTPTPDPRIIANIATLPPYQAEAATKIRELIHRAGAKGAPGGISDVEETIKFTNRPYFTNAGRNIAALLGTKDHLNVFIYDPIAPDPHGLINQGHGNATARAIQIREGDRLDEAAILGLFAAVIANNRAEGWRKLRAYSASAL
jgi:hypothetical protein